MHIPADLQRDLQALTDALEGPDADLSGSIAVLASSARQVAQSYLGLSVLVASGPDAFALTVYDDGADPTQARTSLLLASPPPAGPAPESVVIGVVLYASVPGAFVDLAADAHWLDGAGAVGLDQHLPAPPVTPANTGLEGQSIVNQALGVLLAAGNTLEDARTALDERARGEQVSRAAAARHILDELDERPPQEDR